MDTDSVLVRISQEQLNRPNTLLDDVIPGKLRNEVKLPNMIQKVYIMGAKNYLLEILNTVTGEKHVQVKIRGFSLSNSIANRSIDASLFENFINDLVRKNHIKSKTLEQTQIRANIKEAKVYTKIIKKKYTSASLQNKRFLSSVNDYYLCHYGCLTEKEPARRPPAD